jgi:arylsulfatase
VPPSDRFYNFLGIKPEQKFSSGEIKPGKHVLGVEFIREGAGKYKESTGTAKLPSNPGHRA